MVKNSTKIEISKFDKVYSSLSPNDLEDGGIYNYGFRDYDPVVMRWTTVDPIKDGLNWYAYVNNDPVNFLDLFGLTESDSQGNKPLFDVTILGVRGAAVIGGEIGFGVVVNPNNLWDSGIKLYAGIGLGAEVSIDLPFVNDTVETAIDMVTGMVDLSNPTKTTDIERITKKSVMSFVFGISTNEESDITGIEFGSIGSGIYISNQTVITAGEMAEAVVNTVLSPLRFIGLINRIEIDGVEE